MKDRLLYTRSFLVMRLDMAHIEPLVSAGAKRFQTHKFYARWSGVLPDTSSRIWDEEALDEEDAEAVDESVVVEAELDEAALDEMQEVAVQGSPPLEFVKTRLRSMYRNVHGGCVNHRYTPMAILSYLHLQGLCRPGARANHALASACRLLFGVEGKPLADQIEADIIHTPSRQVLRAARLRLDIVSVIYQQKHFLRFDTIFF